MEKMADNRPDIFAVIVDNDIFAQAFAHNFQPDFGNSFFGQFSVFAFGMNLCFEQMESNLSQRGVNHVVYLCGNQTQFCLVVIQLP